MKVTPVDLHDLDVTASDLVRSSGLHASTIYGAMFKETDPKRYNRGDGPDPLRMSLGTAWEVRLEYLLRRAGIDVIRPGELQSSGGWVMSPDGVIFNGHPTITEYKLTYMSSRDVPRRRGEHFAPKFNKYMVQMQDGCLAAETSHARLYVCFVNGDNQKGKLPTPELLAWDIEFTPRELKENFDAMLNYARQRKML